MRISDWSSDVCSSDLRVGVVIGKVAVDALIQQNVHARQPGDDGGQHLARRAVAGVPGDLQGSPSRDTGEQAFDIGIEDGEAADAAPPARVVSRRRERAERLALRAEGGHLLPAQIAPGAYGSTRRARDKETPPQ